MVDSIKTMCYNVTPPRKTVKKAKKEKTECVIKSKKLETLFKHFGKIKIEVIINKLYELLYYYKLEKNAEKSPKTYKRH